MSAGSCFAANIRRYIEAQGLVYTVSEQNHPLWPEAAENPYYEAFSARYGNIYTPRHMVQILQRALGSFSPTEEYWAIEGVYVDPYRPGLRHPARSLDEFRALTAQHLRAVVRAVEQSTVFIFTLGLTEAWESLVDHAVFPACPGTVAGEFDPLRHGFRTFDVQEVSADLRDMIRLARSIQPSLRVILTVSPVPLVATATGRHVLTATTYSKAVLRIAAEEVANSVPNVAYFPAYELVSGPQAAGTSYEQDRRNVTEEAVATVMSAFFTVFLGTESARYAERERVPQENRRDSVKPDSEALRTLVADAIQASCDEEMMES